MSAQRDLAIIGAGPAGLSAAHEAVRRGSDPLVLEKAGLVGGLARTEIYKGYRFDIGGHRFYTKFGEIERFWHDVLGADFIQVPRLSRIYYDGKFYDYPLNVGKTLRNLGLAESMLIMLSYLKAQVFPYREENTFDQWVSNRFGQRLYRTFFKVYTEKVWGIPCDQIQADWAAQRIRGLSIKSIITNTLFGGNHSKTLINEFQYPVLGPGMMWEKVSDLIVAGGGDVWLGAEVRRLEREGTRITGLIVNRDGQEERISASRVISSMPLPHLVERLEPQPPEEILAAARGLKHRDFVLVGLIVRRSDLFPDNWIYVHSPAVRIGRIQNFRNWSEAMTPDPLRASLGVEYFCTAGDDIWRMADGDLIALASKELEALGLVAREDVEDGLVIRQPGAYPVYDPDYRMQLDTVRGFVSDLDNLQTIGRNGMHRYNNMDHSMLTGIQAVANLYGAEHDLWRISEEQEYLEEQMNEEARKG